jgi:uncharacterized protein YjbI with pentapeptide repeats
MYNDNLHEYYGTHFIDIDFSNRELTSKVFEECQFKRCDFSSTLLIRSKFVDCTFTECNLSLAKVTGTKFSGVEFSECKTVGINWTAAAWSKLVTAAPLTFRKCILHDSSFFGLTLSDFVIEECKARDVDFREADLRGACCSHTDFTSSLFSRTNLSGADFTDATHYDIDVLNNEITGAKFSRYEALRLLDSLEIELVD